MKRLIAAFTLGVMTCSALGEVVYENDFSVRTSAAAVPYGGWREVPYTVGKLASDASSPFSHVAAMDFQDNWIKSEQAYAHVVDLDGNPEALLFYQSAEPKNVVAKHRLGNTFTSGVVVVQCDMKTPRNGSWYSNGSRSVRLLVGDENFFAPGTASYLEYLAGGAGISFSQVKSPENPFRFFLYGYSTDGINSGGYATDPLPIDDRWYRAVITANLDTLKYDAALYNMGTEHPALDAATPATPAWQIEGTNFWCKTKGRTAEFTGIAAVGLACYSVAGSTDNPNQTAHFDNLRVWHNGTECYRNDFSVRRSRSLGGTMVATYEAMTPATNAYSYAVGTKIIEPLDTALETKNYQPIGFDGWRRLNSDSSSTTIPSVTTYSNDNALVFQGSKNGIAAQPLGQTLTGGKVRMSADVRLFAFGGAATGYNTDILLGGDALYSGSNSGNSYNNGLFARIGVTAGNNGATDESGALKRFPRWAVSDDGQGTNRRMAYEDANGAATANKWIRMEIVADLDAGKYDFKIYSVCPATQSPALFAAAGEVLYEKSNIYAYQGQASISTIALSVYNSHSYFDNVCVWHRPAGASAERLVYSNDFSTRRLYGFDGREDALVGTLAKYPVGLDGWTRQYKSSDAFMLVGGENPALGFGTVSAEYSTYAVHDIGGLYGSGKMTASFDVCAPTNGWSDSSSGVWIWLGGDRYHEGNLFGGSGDANYFARWAACGVGMSGTKFVCWTGDRDGGGAWQNSGTPTAGHWYRFVVKPKFSASTSDVAIYDMGTAQPTLATATPAPEAAVVTFSDVPFRQARSLLGGISCIGVQARGVKSASPLTSADYRLLIDNFRVEHQPAGLSVSLH